MRTRTLLALPFALLAGATAHARVTCPSTAYCNASYMPLYDQLNANFAYVVIPGVVYQAEVSQSTAPGLQAVPLPTGAFKDRWLPDGPYPTDTGSIGNTYSAICVPTANSMALVAAIENASTGFVAGSWLDTYFWQALPYKNYPSQGQQGGLPSPLRDDPRSGMQWYDLQGVMNLATYQGTIPNAGCCGYPTTSKTPTNLLTPTAFASFFPPGAVMTSIADSMHNNAGIIASIRSGSVLTLAVQSSIVKINYYTTAVGSPTGQVTYTNHEDVSFVDQPDGHMMAINGHYGSTGTPIVLYDPWLANIKHADFQGPLKGGTSFRHGNTIRTVTMPPGRTYMGVWNNYYGATVTDAWSLYNGQEIMTIQPGGLGAFLVP